MKAALYMGKHDIKMTNISTPECGDNDVLLKNVYASICGTDVAVYKHGPETGHRVDIGGEFGHEMISIVSEVGKNVKDIHVGDRVYPYPRTVKGDPKRAGTVGGFSEYVLAPNAKLNDGIYIVPNEISDKTAALIEPFTVGTRAARRSFPKAGENAIVFGCGTIGIAAAIALKYFGCSRVMIADISDFRLNIAKSLGFEICNSEKENLKEKAMKIFGTADSIHGKTADVDIYIDAAGAEQIISDYQDMGKIESRLVVVAVLAGMRPINVLDMTYSQHAIIGSGGYMPEDVKDIIAIMSSGKWKIESIITDEYPWEQLPQAIEKASDTASSFNVVIKY
ncbi:MAG: zinc-binding dehydrogenase [Ruminococcus sp.]|nr:zinc-binding dehydrogenase [Ruminococcus sp.]